MSLKRSCVSLASLSSQSVRDFLASVDVILSDCDGVLWKSGEVIEGAMDALNYFKNHGKRVYFLTNNSRKTRDTFVERFHKLGFECDKEEIISAAFLAAQYLKSINFDKKVYVIGTDAISTELDLVGIAHSGVGPEVFLESESFDDFINSFQPDPEIGAVIVGHDAQISIKKIISASTYVSNPEAIFIATSKDARYLSKRPDIIIPGVGSMVASIEVVTSRSAIILGKPETFIYDCVRKLTDINPARTLMIGDRCNTDILLGTRCGFQTLLVLTGVTKLEDVIKYQNSNLKEELDLVPDFYINSIGDLVHLHSE